MQNSPLPDDGEQIHMMGISPNVPFYDLNLAGAQGVPAPDRPAQSPAAASGNAPTFSGPDMRAPALAPYDLSQPGIDFYPALQADPLLPDLDDYDHPSGLDIWPTTSGSIDPSLADHLLDDRPTGLDVTHDATEPDPPLPDLQHPDLTPQVRMLDRPGDLDASALSIMHLGATYQQLDDKGYPEVFMDQAGMNTSRTRHMDLLMRGLDAEER
jgi:hypothetical protein